MGRMLSLKEWLAKFGKDDCYGCQFNNPVKASCHYKAGYCVRYDLYKAAFKAEQEQLSLWN